MYLRRLITAAFTCLLPGLALAQTSYIAPDHKNRYPGVTIFCPSGTGVAPCNFSGGGAGGGSVSITSGGAAVSSSNRFPVADTALDALISSGALTVGGTVSLTGSPAVTLGAGSATVGAVTQSGTWSVGLAAGGNAIGSVSVSNLPATQAVSATSLPLPSGAATAAQQAAPLGPVAPGTATATNAVVIGCLSNTTLPSFAAGQQGAVPCDSSGRPYVVTVPSQNNVPTYLQAVSSGGATAYRAINTAASTMATNIKTSSGLLYGYETCNAGASAVYFRIFGVTTTPLPGTSTPTISKLLPAGTCQAFSSQVGITIPNGIGFDVTSGSLADSDGTAVATANQVTVQIYYK
jgi:hypothetical protein